VIDPEQKDVYSLLSPEQRRMLATVQRMCAGCAVTLSLAGELTEDVKLREELLADADRWRLSAEDLKSLVGGEALPESRWAGVVTSLRHTWLSVKATIGDTRAITDECDRRKLEARSELENLAQSAIPAELRTILAAIERRLSGPPSDEEGAPLP
jgi:hypothetical protein